MSNSHKLSQRKFSWIKEVHRAAERDVEFPPFQIFKTQLNKVLINLIKLLSSLSLEQEIQLADFQKSLPN